MKHAEIPVYTTTSWQKGHRPTKGNLSDPHPGALGKQTMNFSLLTFLLSSAGCESLKSWKKALRLSPLCIQMMLMTTVNSNVGFHKVGLLRETVAFEKGHKLFKYTSYY